MPEQWATRDDVREMGRDIKEHIERRFSETREIQAERHDENVDRMDAMLAEARKTNGRVTTLETMHRALHEEFQAIRKRWHDFRDSIQSKLSTEGAGENRHLTMRDVYVFVGGFTMFYALGKLMKWIP